MRFNKKLYIGEKARQQKKKIMWNARRHRIQPGIYFITFSENQKNLLDIYPSWVLLQKYYRQQKLTVLGIGQGKDEALAVVQEIVMECYNEMGNIGYEQLQSFFYGSPVNKVL